jgi:electron transport complex protein RnfG
MSKPEASSFRLVATLAATGLLSGLMLVGVYLGTYPRIQRNRAEAIARAVVNVLPGTERHSAFVLREGKLRKHEGPEDEPPPPDAIFAGFDVDGSLVGYAIPSEGPGYMDTIKLIYGFDPARRVIVGMEVLDSRETPGLGDKIIKDDDFRANFEALAVEPTIEPVKKGAKTSPNQVDCITGATISSEAVVKILNKGNEQWLELLDGAGESEGGAADVARSRR